VCLKTKHPYMVGMWITCEQVANFLI